MKSKPSTVLSSETHTLVSAAGREYRVTVALPLAYDSAPNDAWPFAGASARWPTVYVLDGNWYFGLVTDVIRPMSWCGGTRDAIVVGIGYGEDPDPREAFRSAFTRRNSDLTPTRDAAEERSMAGRFNRPAPTGGADSFHRFICAELTPFIESRYRADSSQRSLVGHSYGGLFAAYSLFRAPEHFHAYIIGSPTLAFGQRYVFRQELQYARGHKRLPARIFLYAGNEESADDTTLTDTLRFAAILRGRGYRGLNLRSEYFPAHDHCAVAAPGIHAGLKFALGHIEIKE